MKNLFMWVCVGPLLWVGISPAWGQPRVSVEANAPVVVFLRTADTDPTRAKEERLFQALGLALDSFALLSMPSPDSFAASSSDTQLAAIQELATNEGAVAVTWVTQHGGDALVHLAVVQTGRLLVRQFQGTRRGTKDADLALAVRELLGTAYLFEPREEQAPVPAVRALVDEVKRHVVAEAPPPPAPPSHWKVSAAAVVETAFRQGAQVGGSAWGEYEVISALSLGVGGEATEGVLQRTDAASIRALAAGGSAALTYGFRWGRLVVGPRLTVGAIWRQFTTTTATENAVFTGVEPRITAGLELQLALWKGVGLRLAPRATLWPLETRVLSRASGLTIAQLPQLEWGLELGMLVEQPLH